MFTLVVRKCFTVIILLLLVETLKASIYFHKAKGDFLDEYKLNFNTSYISYGSPYIVSESNELNLELHQDIELRCEGREPLTWKTPTDFTNFIITNEYNPDEERPYVSILKLINVFHKNVDFYNCVYNNTLDFDNSIEDFVKLYKASRIYIFVDDPYNLMVPMAYAADIVRQHKLVTIPCKPTSKHVKVVLTKDGVEKNHEIHSQFNPKIGFMVKFDAVSDTGDYCCKVLSYKKMETNYTKKLCKYITVDDSLNRVPEAPLITYVRYATEGDQLVLNCTTTEEAGLSLEWSYPDDDVENNSRVQMHEFDTDEGYIKQLVINNLSTAKDTGFYKCTIRKGDSENYSEEMIKIFRFNESLIEIKEPSNRHTIVIDENKQIQWYITINAYPHIQLLWISPRGVEIRSDNKYGIKLAHHEVFLTIKNVQLEDAGKYELRGSNAFQVESLILTVIVKAKPRLNITSMDIKQGEEATVKCSCRGYPLSVISFVYTPCTYTSTGQICSKTSSISYMKENIIKTDETDTSQEVQLKFKPDLPGTVKCIANSTLGITSETVDLRISDLDSKEMDVWIVNNTQSHIVPLGDEVSIECAAVFYVYNDKLTWHIGNEKIHEIDTDNMLFTKYSTPYSYRKRITWLSFKPENSGMYSCSAEFIDVNNVDTNYVNIIGETARAPTVIDCNMDGQTIALDSTGWKELMCNITGLPEPTIEWYKDGELITEDTASIKRQDKTLSISMDLRSISGTYKCVAQNKLGEISREIIITDPNVISKTWFFVIGGLIFILLFSICMLWIRVRREKRLRKELRAAGIADFNDGRPGSINPALTLDEQADLLPYDPKYEFPRDKLKLGKQLGAGAFGIVVKAEAQGILPYEDETTVAVKMVKVNADNEVMRALVSELKIMVHLGQHLNVLNLLGAVTKNILNRELMVIVEFCPFGNVQNFLLRHRNFYIDQINPETDAIDPNVLTFEQRWSNDSGYEYNSRGEDKRGSARRSGNSQDVNSKGYMPHSNLDYFPGGIDSCNTEASLITGSAGEETVMLSNNSEQPAWRSNYRMDYKASPRIITTSDLVCWGFQIARGMDYLSSRKVLHGDLAARNILLCEDNVVKICDFGLAKSMYRSNNYKKSGEAPLPFKWLAIESIGDQIFSTHSDVWAFGIVLWEFFSLAKVPYPGMDADQNLYDKLTNGYRMEKPKYATQEIYDIMLNCWNKTPESRPVFNELEKRLGKLLNDGVKDHYLDLNEPYLQFNEQTQKQGGKTDYLTLVAQPEGIAPLAPIYVNSHITPFGPINDSSTHGGTYMEMSPNMNLSINSPLQDKNAETHFDFPAPTSPTIVNNLNKSPIEKSKNKPIKIPEEEPMLQQENRNSDLNDDTSNIKDDIKLKNNLELIKNDNYVNVPSTLSNINEKINNKNSNLSNVKSNTKDAFSNPSYITLQKN